MNLDAYTVRKIAPRLFFAVVGINISIYLCVAAVDITSVVGHGLAYLIRAPFDTSGALHSKVDEGAANAAAPLFVVGLLAAIVTLKGATGAVLSTIWFLLLPVFILILTTLITLALRQALLVLLTLVSPVAIVLAVLPGTEKYFKQWWDLFLKTLIVYPIIAALFAVSDVLTAISFNASGEGSNIAGSIDVVNGLLYAFMPLVMIPFAFRMAGGALGGFFNATQAMRSAVNRYSMGGLQKNFTEGLERTKAASLFNSKTRQAPVYARNEDGSYKRDANGNLIQEEDEHGRPVTRPEGYGLRHRLNMGAAYLSNMNEMRMNNMRGSVSDATQRAIMKRAGKALESDQGKIIAGFDDELWAAIHSDGTDAGIRSALRERAGPRFDDLADGITEAERVKRRQDLDAATSMVKEFNRVGGPVASKAAAAVGLHGVSTSYDTQYKRINPITNQVENAPWIEGKHPISQKSDQVYKSSERQMQESILVASGGMRGLGNWITAESIKGTKQAGRYDLAASASAVVMYQEAMRSGNKKAIEDIEKYYKKMMVERVTPAQMLQGHPRAAKEMAIVWKEHLENLASAMNPENLKGDSLEDMQKRQEEFLRAIGDVAGIQDVLGSSGKEAVDYFDKGLMSQKITVNLNGRPQTQTIEHILDEQRTNPIVHRRRHEYRRSAGLEGDDEEAAAHMGHLAHEASHIEPVDHLNPHL